MTCFDQLAETISPNSSLKITKIINDDAQEFCARLLRRSDSEHLPYHGRDVRR